MRTAATGLMLLMGRSDIQASRCLACALEVRGLVAALEFRERFIPRTLALITNPLAKGGED